MTEKLQFLDRCKRDIGFERDIVLKFHKLYYYKAAHRGTWKNTWWLGVHTQKCPLDLWVYQEILYEIKPDLIIETGTARGGSAYFFASICDLVGKGEIITVDIRDYEGRPSHPRIEYVKGSSVSEEVIERIEYKIQETSAKRVLVCLDSNHKPEHVLEELRLYSKYVSIGDYVVVEDTNIGTVVCPEHRGPLLAVETFLKESPKFVRDKTKEKFYLTFSPNGWLKRIW